MQRNVTEDVGDFRRRRFDALATSGQQPHHRQHYQVTMRHESGPPGGSMESPAQNAPHGKSGPELVDVAQRLELASQLLVHGGVLLALRSAGRRERHVAGNAPPLETPHILLAVGGQRLGQHIAGHVVGRRQTEALCQTGRLLGPDEAISIGLVDRLAPVDQVVDAAVEWCAELTELPAYALGETRRTVRRDLIEIVTRSKSTDAEEMTLEWFRPEVQAPLRALAEQLAKK
ncbi:hypothetical protein DRQ50_13215 [bacterium]|nr:MAG: hypothetical protein DRQ50_13215 [bacterium]